MIKATVAGNIGRDAEVGTTGAGTATLRFNVASTERRGGEKATTWVTVTVFGNRATALAPMATTALGKGAFVVVTGSLSLREYEGRDGAHRASLDMVADDIAFGPSRFGAGDVEVPF